MSSRSLYSARTLPVRDCRTPVGRGPRRPAGGGGGGGPPRRRPPGGTRGPQHAVLVERHRALYGSWYEFFPRSTGGRDATGKPVHGTFATAA
ncbi:hypothetical protein, partial [Nocardia abscessus]|uniref:hypothetical protein n=1 Tax=Nocardia abscessus TaxID=120957 RepID=UPI0024589A59